MKKTLLLIFMVAAGVALCVTGAWAYQFNPPTEVESYQYSSAMAWNGTDYWYPVIAGSGDTSFNIAGANLVGSTLDIFTGWPGPTASDLTAVAADLSLYSAGTSWAVRLSNTNGDMGTLFQNPSYNNSISYFSSTGYIYGGAYDKTNPQPVPVWATSSPYGAPSGLVTWLSPAQDGTAYWEVQVALSAIQGFNTAEFSFLYASGTCANSVLTGSAAPLPPSVLLLGTGLVGLAFLRRRVEPKKEKVRRL